MENRLLGVLFIAVLVTGIVALFVLSNEEDDANYYAEVYENGYAPEHEAEAKLEAAPTAPEGYISIAGEYFSTKFTLSLTIFREVLEATEGGIDQFLKCGFRILYPCTRPYVIYNAVITRRSYP